MIDIFEIEGPEPPETELFIHAPHSHGADNLIDSYHNLIREGVPSETAMKHLLHGEALSSELIRMENVDSGLGNSSQQSRTMRFFRYLARSWMS